MIHICQDNTCSICNTQQQEDLPKKVDWYKFVPFKQEDKTSQPETWTCDRCQATLSATCQTCLFCAYNQHVNIT